MICSTERRICSPPLLLPLLLATTWSQAAGPRARGTPGPTATKEQSQLLPTASPALTSALAHEHPGWRRAKHSLLKGLVGELGVYYGVRRLMGAFLRNVARKRTHEVLHLPDRWQGHACAGPFLRALLHCGGDLHDNASREITRAAG